MCLGSLVQQQQAPTSERHPATSSYLCAPSLVKTETFDELKSPNSSTSLGYNNSSLNKRISPTAAHQRRPFKKQYLDHAAGHHHKNPEGSLLTSQHQPYNLGLLQHDEMVPLPQGTTIISPDMRMERQPLPQHSMMPGTHHRNEEGINLINLSVRHNFTPIFKISRDSVHVES